MAQVKIQSIIEHLDYDVKRALEDAVSHVLPHANIDRNELGLDHRAGHLASMSVPEYECFDTAKG